MSIEFIVTLLICCVKRGNVWVIIFKKFSIPFFLRTGIVLQLFLLPLFSVSSAYNSFESPKVILFRITTEILFILLITYSISHKKPIVKHGMLVKSVLLLGIVFYLSSILGVDYSQSFFGQYFRNQGFLTFIHYLFFFLLVSVAPSFGIRRFQVIIPLIVSGTIVSFWAFGQAIAHTFFGIPVLLFNDRYVLNFGNPNFFGAFVALTIPATLYLLISAKSLLKKIVFSILLVNQFAGIFLSGSRGALLGASVAMLLFPLLLAKSRAGRLFGIFMALLSGALVISYIYTVPRDSPNENRIRIWQKGIEAGLQRPVFGYGLENFEFAIEGVLTDQDIGLRDLRIDKAHNEILEIFVAGGVVGLTVFLAILIYFFHRVWKGLTSKEEEEKKWNIFLITTMTTFLIIASTNVLSITSYLIFWLILALSEWRDQMLPVGVIPKVPGVLAMIILVFLVIFNIRFMLADIEFKKGMTIETQGEKNDHFRNALKIFPWERVYRFKAETGN